MLAALRRARKDICAVGWRFGEREQNAIAVGRNARVQRGARAAAYTFAGDRVAEGRNTKCIGPDVAQVADIFEGALALGRRKAHS